MCYDDDDDDAQRSRLRPKLVRAVRMYVVRLASYKSTSSRDHGSWIMDQGCGCPRLERIANRVARSSRLRPFVCPFKCGPPPPRRAPGLYSPSGTVSSSYGTFGTDTDTFRYFASLPPVRGTRSPPLAFAAVRSSLESGLCALLARSLHCTGWR